MAWVLRLRLRAFRPAIVPPCNISAPFHELVARAVRRLLSERVQSARIIAIGCAPFFLITASAALTEPTATLRVATFALPPHVFSENGRLTGFSIDLWNAVAERLGVRSQIEVVPDVDVLLGSVRDGRADLGVSGIYHEC
jgi:polar amino acid transport system substrate-binding protein